MALTAREKDQFTHGIADKGAADEMLSIINSGTKATLSQRAKDALRNALGTPDRITNILNAFQSGAATINAYERGLLHELMGDLESGKNLETELEAIV